MKVKIIAKIQKLLTLARNQFGNPEGETAKDLAKQLMEKYCIQNDEIGSFESNSIDGFILGYVDDLGPVQWVSALTKTISDTFGTIAVFTRDPKFVVRFLGGKGSVDISESLFIVLQQYLVMNSWNTFSGTEKEDHAARRQFCHAAVSIINERLATIRAAMMKEKSETQPSHSVMGLILSNKSLTIHKLNEFMKDKQESNSEKLKKEEPVNRDAWLKGMRTGALAPLNKEVSNTKYREIGG